MSFSFGSNTTGSTGGGFSFGTSGTTGASTGGTGGFGFGGGTTGTTGTGFGTSGTGTSGGFSFGGTTNAATGGTGATGFSFGGGTTGATAGTSGFGFGSTPAAGTSNAFSFGGANAGAATGGFGLGATTGASGFGTGASAFGTGGTNVLGGMNNGQAGIQWPGTQAGIRAGSNPMEKIQTLLAAYGQQQQNGRQGAGRFQCVMYNKSSNSQLSQQYRQHPEMFKPQGFPDHMWDAANRHNPDPDHLIPAAVRNYAQLKQRAAKHAEGLQAIEGFCAKVEKDLAEMRTSHEQTVKKDIASLKQQQVRLTERLLKCLRKLMVRETAPLNGEELTLKRRLQLIHKQLSHPADFTSRIEDLMSSARMNKRARRANLEIPDEKNMARMLQFLKEQQQILKELMGTTQKDMRDLSIISRELSSQIPAITQY